jgi:hypothetical protein
VHALKVRIISRLKVVILVVVLYKSCIAVVRSRVRLFFLDLALRFHPLFGVLDPG